MPRVRATAKQHKPAKTKPTTSKQRNPPIKKPGKVPNKSTGKLIETKTFADLKKENSKLRKENAKLHKQVSAKNPRSKQSNIIKTLVKKVTKSTKKSTKSASKTLTKGANKAGKSLGKTLGEKFKASYKTAVKSFTIAKAPTEKRKTIAAVLNDLEKPGAEDIVRKKLGLKENQYLAFSLYGHRSNFPFASLSDMVGYLNKYQTIQKYKGSRGINGQELFSELKIIGWKNSPSAYRKEKEAETKQYHKRKKEILSKLKKAEQKLKRYEKRIAEYQDEKRKGRKH